MDQKTTVNKDMVKSFLGFVDRNVLFKKPVSCLFAIISLVLPVYFLAMSFAGSFFTSGDAKLIIAVILTFFVFAFAGLFGALIWWHRRIKPDEGTSAYKNFRCFVQTLGEWLGVTIAIVAFGGVLVLWALLQEGSNFILGVIPVPFISRIAIEYAFIGPIIGFLIIILTKILLFLIDPVIWLCKQIWKLFVRIVLYIYRCIINVCTTCEAHTRLWIGCIWILSALAVLTGLGLLLSLFVFRDYVIFSGGLIALALGFALMAFLVLKRKSYDA